MSLQAPGTGTLGDQIVKIERRLDESIRASPLHPVKVNTSGYLDTTNTWVTLVLVNGWVARTGYKPPGAKRMPDGTVRLRGAAESGVSDDETILSTIPAALRPTVNVATSVASGNVDTPSARILVVPTGELYIYGCGDNVALDGATYTTD